MIEKHPRRPRGSQSGRENRRDHPRRPRGSQSGRENRRDESFQVRAKEPLGTDSYRSISKNSNGCRLLIGHKKTFVLLCPISEQYFLSSFHVFVHDGYYLAILVWFVHQGFARETFTFLLPQTETKELSMTRKNVWDDYSHLHQENSASDRSQGIVNNVNRRRDR